MKGKRSENLYSGSSRAVDDCECMFSLVHSNVMRKLIKSTRAHSQIPLTPSYTCYSVASQSLPLQIDVYHIHCMQRDAKIK